MLVDKLNAMSAYSVNRNLQSEGNETGRSDIENESGSGKSGDAGPAVVSELSSTALETSRAVKAADETTDQNAAGQTNDSGMDDESGTRQQALDVII